MTERLQTLSEKEMLEKGAEKVIDSFKLRILAYPIIGALANIGLAEVSKTNYSIDTTTNHALFGAAIGLFVLGYRTVGDIRALARDEILNPDERKKQ